MNLVYPELITFVVPSTPSLSVICPRSLTTWCTLHCVYIMYPPLIHLTWSRFHHERTI